jgi:hypothetical protein
MTIKLELTGIFILYSWPGSILGDSIEASKALITAIPQGKVRKLAVSFAANGVGIGSSPEDKANYWNKEA